MILIIKGEIVMCYIITPVSGEKIIKNKKFTQVARHITPRQQHECVRWDKGCFRKNLHISETESNLIILQGENRNSPKLQRGKNILNQI